LYAPSEYGLALWDALRADGVTPGGYRAIESLRLEKGYRAWASDLSAETTPYEAGLGFAVKLDKGDFLGRAALDGHEPAEKLVCLVLDDPRAGGRRSQPGRLPRGQPLGPVPGGG